MTRTSPKRSVAALAILVAGLASLALVRLEYSTLLEGIFFALGSCFDARRLPFGAFPLASRTPRHRGAASTGSRCTATSETRTFCCAATLYRISVS